MSENAKQDVLPITGSIQGVTPLIAARLCNFPTGSAQPLFAHRFWIGNEFKNACLASPNPWIDVFAYASHRGRATGYDNQALSVRRRNEVIKEIAKQIPTIRFMQQDALGDSQSSGNINDDSGEWRAVSVYVYGALPPGRKAEPVALPVPKDWYVTYFSGSTTSVIVGGGFTAITGHITFEKPNGDKYTGPIGIIGPSVGLSYVPSGVAKRVSDVLYQQIARRFPALAQFLLPESAGLANGLLKWLTSSGGLGKLLWNSPGLNLAVNALRKGIFKIGGGASGSAESWWSGAIGIVYGSRGREVQKADFAGPCLCYAVTGTIAVGGFGIYVLFFGLDRHWRPWDSPVDLVDLMSLEGKAKGVAVMSAASVAAQIPGLGAGATVFYGEIV